MLGRYDVVEISREHLKKFWDYLLSVVEEDELNSIINEFDFDRSSLDRLNELSEDEIDSIFNEMVYMILNELYSGNFEMMFDTLTGAVGLSDEDANYLLDW